MKNIIATIKNNDTWDIVKISEVSTLIELEFFLEEAITESLANQFKFGFDLRNQEGKIIHQGVFPTPTSYYGNLSEGTVEVLRLSVLPDTDYVLSMWALKGIAMFNGSLNFKTEKPASPFKSWGWKERAWEPPMPYPSDGKYYSWDEETLSWKEQNIEN